MTREKVIKALNEYGTFKGEAVDMAAETLNDIAKWRTWSHTYDNICMNGEKNEMTKEEAIHILRYERDNDIFCSPYRQRVRVAMDMAIEALQTPSITQRAMYQAGYKQAQEDRPKGEWVEPTSYDGLSADYYICSKCKRMHSQAFNYCPSCGADMRERRKE